MRNIQLETQEVHKVPFFKSFEENISAHFITPKLFIKTAPAHYILRFRPPPIARSIDLNESTKSANILGSTQHRLQNRHLAPKGKQLSVQMFTEHGRRVAGTGRRLEEQVWGKGRGFWETLRICAERHATRSSGRTGCRVLLKSTWWGSFDDHNRSLMPSVDSRLSLRLELAEIPLINRRPRWLHNRWTSAWTVSETSESPVKKLLCITRSTVGHVNNGSEV